MSATRFILGDRRRKPGFGVSLLVFAVGVGLMGWFRLYLFPHQVITLTYGLPLLVCVWVPSRGLLWSMAVAFFTMSAWKAFRLLPQVDVAEWSMQVINIAVVAVAVHLILDFVEALMEERVRLEETNQELVTREEEIQRQNDELQNQAEELSRQNEEIQQQAEELQQQTEELQQQADELQQLNAELGKRQTVLEVLLGTLHVAQGAGARGDLPARICASLIDLFAGATAAAIRERRDERLVCQAQAGLGDADDADLERSFAAVVMAHDRSAFVADLRLRPDLTVPHPPGGELRSVIATPLRVDGVVAGCLEVYAAGPRQWTAQEFRILEWAAAQCALIIEVRRLHSELSRTNTGLDRLVKERTAELEEMVNELEHFSYTITHDLRAPLRAMHGFSEMLAEECKALLTDEGRAYVGRIASAASRMDRLITDALSFSKVMRQELDLTEQDPAALLQGMMDSYPVFQAPRARIRIEGPLPRVLANEAGLTQCFSNLLGNAVKFVPKDRVPEVTVRAESQDGFVRIWFEDNGIGISPEMRSRVFGMFQRLSKDYEGTGIGLALVKKVAERMQGRVGFESNPGAGSRFWVELKLP